MTYIIVDALRLGDFHRMDTIARTPEEAKALAEEMAKRYGTKVTILAPVAVCEGSVEPRWIQDLSPVSPGWSMS